MKKHKWDSGSSGRRLDWHSKVLRKILNDYRLIVTEAGNGQIALDEVKKKSLGVIFLDLMMPIMDGFKFLKN